jgi:signal transduction histidine kinase
VTGLTIRTALMLGFGITLALWLLAGYRMTQRMQQVESQTSNINRRYILAQDQLATVRTQVLLGSVSVRDALLDPNPGSTSLYRKQFEDACAEANRALSRYVPILDTPDERANLTALRAEIEAYRKAMLAVFDAELQPGSHPPAKLIEDRVVREKRDVIVSVAERIQALNRRAFVRRRDETAELNREAQRSAWQKLGVSLGAGLLVGLLATFYAGRLEGQLRRQRSRDLRITEDLHRLSAKLATAQEDERRAISRELHDEVGQALTAIRVELGLVQRTNGVPAVAAARLEDARIMTEDAIRTIRDLSHLLHPSLLDDLGLAVAVKNYLEGFTKRQGIRTELIQEHMAQRLAPELEVALYRIVQEALTNVAKHAHASLCRVFLQGLTTTVLVTIEDDGSGFDAAEMERLGHAQGLGLIGMRERVQQFGGTFRLETAPGQGTRLTIEVPARRHSRLDTGHVAALQPYGELTNGEPAHLSR